MGVLGLWQLLAPVGQPVTLESLENKIFAVDISIWLNQAVKGYRDSQGGSVANAHLLSLFSRLCKLLFYRIRPIIVFDGGFPELKKQTIINRQKRRAAVKQASKDLGLKVLSNYLASKNLAQEIDIPSTSSKSFKYKEKSRDEIFKLPPLPEGTQSFLSESVEDFERKFTNFSKDDIKYLNQIDIDSDDFNNLPADVKQEILSTLKESRKHRTWEQFEELPKESNEFSKYQMQCLLKKRKLQGKLEEVQKDLRRINSESYVSQYINDHVIGETNKIMSDDTSYYVLLKKTVNKKESDLDQSGNQKHSMSAMADSKSAFIRDIENIDVYGDSNEDVKQTINNSLSDRNISLTDENAYSLHQSGKDPKCSSKWTSKSELKSFISLDEECDVDDPPVPNIDEQNIKLSILCNSEINNDNDIFITSKNTIVSESENSSAEESSNKETNFLSQLSPKTNLSINHQNVISIETANNNESKITIPLNDRDRKVSNESIDSTNQLIIGTDVNNVSNISLNSKCGSLEGSVENVLTKSIIVSSEDELIACGNIDSENEFQQANLIDVTAKPDVCFTSNTCNQSRKLADQPEKLESTYVKSVSPVFLPEDPLESTSFNTRNITQLRDEKLQEANLDLQKDIETAVAVLEAEQAKQDRQARSVQDHMIEECKELLQLFGIPYIVSPSEAEAQCAFYDKVELTHGTITDDSDVWLFGGKRVLKNFFSQQKFVESYKDKEIFMHFGLNREKLINFALLTGSDYTVGIEGVGYVTAMEIISEFPGEGVDALKKFKTWWDDSNKHTRTPENKIRAKLRKLVLADKFPDDKVFNAYLHPEVDNSTEKFSWGRPDLYALREYTRERFGWNQNKVDDMLLPVLKKLNEKDQQTHIDSFFSVTLKKQTNLFPSKRIMSALQKISSPEKSKIIKETVSKVVKRKARTSKKQCVNKKLNKISVVRGTKSHIKSQGPALSESSSDSS